MSMLQWNLYVSDFCSLSLSVMCSFVCFPFAFQLLFYPKIGSYMPETRAKIISQIGINTPIFENVQFIRTIWHFLEMLKFITNDDLRGSTASDWLMWHAVAFICSHFIFDFTFVFYCRPALGGKHQAFVILLLPCDCVPAGLKLNAFVVNWNTWHWHAILLTRVLLFISHICVEYTVKKWWWARLCVCVCMSSQQANKESALKFHQHALAVLIANHRIMVVVDVQHITNSMRSKFASARGNPRTCTRHIL